VGTNELIGDDIVKLSACLKTVLAGEWKKGSIPELWDGNTSDRIVNILHSIYNK
jgi:UDP-N-acetylglucosamine 2-epimerase (non-hydrolysing)